MNAPVYVLADADEAVRVLEEHLLEGDHHALEVARPLLDVVADLQKNEDERKIRTQSKAKQSTAHTVIHRCAHSVI
jgi:hypothetical protein